MNEESKKEALPASEGSSDPLVRLDPISGKGAPNAFEQLRKELEMIEAKYSNAEVQAGLASFMKQNGYVQASPGKKRKPAADQKQHVVQMMNHVPQYFVPAEKHLVRYFLMDALRMAGHDIVLHEFAYMRCFCDVLGVVMGRATEFEIKASRADYENDFKKNLFKGRPTNKHGLLAAGGTMISRFYFVVPDNMVDIREVPPHAGMIWYHMDGDVPVFRVIKPPPLLNKEYLSPGAWQTISKRLQLRNWSIEDRYSSNKKFAQIKKDYHQKLRERYAQNNAADRPADAG